MIVTGAWNLTVVHDVIFLHHSTRLLVNLLPAHVFCELLAVLRVNGSTESAYGIACILSGSPCRRKTAVYILTLCFTILNRFASLY